MGPVDLWNEMTNSSRVRKGDILVQINDRSGAGMLDIGECKPPLVLRFERFDPAPEVWTSIPLGEKVAVQPGYNLLSLPCKLIIEDNSRMSIHKEESSAWLVGDLVPPRLFSAKEVSSGCCVWIFNAHRTKKVVIAAGASLLKFKVEERGRADQAYFFEREAKESRAERSGLFPLLLPSVVMDESPNRQDIRDLLSPLAKSVSSRTEDADDESKGVGELTDKWVKQFTDAIAHKAMGKVVVRRLDRFEEYAKTVRIGNGLCTYSWPSRVSREETEERVSSYLLSSGSVGVWSNRIKFEDLLPDSALPLVRGVVSAVLNPFTEKVESISCVRKSL